MTDFKALFQPVTKPLQRVFKKTAVKVRRAKRGLSHSYYNLIEKLSAFSFQKFSFPVIPHPSINLPYKNLLKQKVDIITVTMALIVLVLFLVPLFMGSEKQPLTSPFITQFGTVNATPLSQTEKKNSTPADITKIEDDIKAIYDDIEPAVGDKTDDMMVETDNIYIAQTVLIPQKTMVVSSSRDDQIEDIPFHSGDLFKKGDALITYDCKELEAEAEIAQSETQLTTRKAEEGYKLFKLDLISDIDRLDFDTEKQKATARRRLYDARMKDCKIRADFDGRVTKRLANPGEYTRTDRVLMEVASTESLQAEFLLPSIWLRHVNINAPLRITIWETGKSYNAKIIRIHGRVDPISQTIQVTAQMDAYTDPLLPGMSGEAVLDIRDIESSGITPYLNNYAENGGENG